MNTKQIDVSIENILDSDHTNAQLWRSILGYFRKIFSSQNSQVDVTTLGKWLLNNHPPFRKKYENSHIVMSFRLQSIRTTIKNRLDELSRLTLIRWVDTAKSQKNDSTKKLYALTEEGHYVAWLIEAKYQLNQKERTTADIKIIEILETFFDRHHSALSIAFTRFLEKCKNNLERDNVSMVNVGFFRTMLPSVVRMLQNKNIMLYSVSIDKTLGRIFLDVVKELDEETRRLVFFQIKSDVESSISATMDITREWETARYNDIYCHNKITTLQFCERCEKATPYKVDTVDFLKSSIDVSIKREEPIRQNKFDCHNCGKSNNTVRQYLQCFILWIEGLGESITKIGTKSV